jgi:hypothetical protein
LAHLTQRGPVPVGLIHRPVLLGQRTELAGVRVGRRDRVHPPELVLAQGRLGTDPTLLGPPGGQPDLAHVVGLELGHRLLELVRRLGGVERQAPLDGVLDGRVTEAAVDHRLGRLAGSGTVLVGDHLLAGRPQAPDPAQDGVVELPVLALQVLVAQVLLGLHVLVAGQDVLVVGLVVPDGTQGRLRVVEVQTLEGTGTGVVPGELPADPAHRFRLRTLPWVVNLALICSIAHGTVEVNLT